MNEREYIMRDYDITEIGLGESLEGALCYLLGPVTGVIFFVLEKHNRFVRFHAIQSILLSFVLIILTGFVTVVGTLSYIYWTVLIIGPLLSLTELLLWIFLMLKAYQHEKFKIPIIGDFAEDNINLKI